MDLLRQIVASPRARHPETGLDLCYVTDYIVATSGPGSTYPQVAYRNPLKSLVKFLDSEHGEDWAIWEFRAEGTGYPDSDVYNRVWHYPWPDHHPPPFNLVPLIMASMRNWLKGKEAEGKKRIAVVHCKAGKGRSGTITCSYLISEEGWSPEDAMKRFTERRMRPGFGNGISIPSQLRWVTYVDRWTRNGKIYVERPVEVVELHVWGLRNGVKIGVEGYVDEGKVIKNFHTFHKSERRIVRGEVLKENGFADVALEIMGKKKTDEGDDAGKQIRDAEKAEQEAERVAPDDESDPGGDIVFTPSKRIVLPTSDVNIDFERRNKSKYGGFTMVTSVAHVWFNCFFEGNGAENKGIQDDAGVFEIDFDAMDGIKGSSRKGTKCFDRMSVVWKIVQNEHEPSVVVSEPREGEEVKQARPADWRGSDNQSEDAEKKLGLRQATDASAQVSRANSVHESKSGDSDKEEIEGTKASGPDGRTLDGTQDATASSRERELKTKSVPRGAIVGPHIDRGQPSTADLPDGRPEHEMENHKDHVIGSTTIFKKRKSSS